MKGVIGGLYRDRVHLDTSACGGLCDLVDEQPICRKGAWQAGFIFNTSIDAYNCADVTCADVEPFCGEASEIGLRARMMCPSTCRCDEPRSPLALSLPTSGCPAGCKRTVRYKVEMAQLPCEDVDKSDANFVSFLDEWKAAETTWPQDWREGSEGFISFFKQEGCSYLAATTPPAGLSPSFLASFGAEANLCVQDGAYFPLKAMSIFCPVSCGCHSGDNDCPDSCPARKQAREGNVTTRIVEYHGIPPNYVLPSSRIPGYVVPP